MGERVNLNAERGEPPDLPVSVHTLNKVGVTQFGAREKRLNGPTPLYPPSPRPKGPWGGGINIFLEGVARLRRATPSKNPRRKPTA